MRKWTNPSHREEKITKGMRRKILIAQGKMRNGGKYRASSINKNTKNSERSRKKAWKTLTKKKKPYKKAGVRLSKPWGGGGSDVGGGKRGGRHLVSSSRCRKSHTLGMLWIRGNKRRIDGGEE